MDRNISQETVATIKAMGFDVYAPEKGLTSYLYFTDGKNIGYLETGRFGGFHLSTVHVPNRNVGTGFGIGDFENLDIETLTQAFIHSPNWSDHDRKHVRKYYDMDAFVTSRVNNIIPLVKVA